MTDTFTAAYIHTHKCALAKKCVQDLIFFLIDEPTSDRIARQPHYTSYKDLEDMINGTSNVLLNRATCSDVVELVQRFIDAEKQKQSTKDSEFDDELSELHTEIYDAFRPLIKEHFPISNQICYEHQCSFEGLLVKFALAVNKEY